MSSIQTYKNLTDQVLKWLDEANDTSTTQALVQQALNNANRLRSTQERWHWMRWDTPETFTTVPGQQLYSLHSEFHRPIYFWNRTQGNYIAQYTDETRTTDGLDPNNDTDSASRFEFRGITEVQNQPSSASVIAVASTAGADNGSSTVTIKGDTTQGVRSETVAAGSSSSTSFTKILKVTKNGNWTGTMTLTSNAGAVTNLTLFPEEYGRSYRQFFLLASPQQSDVIEYPFYRQPTTMSADNDRPDVPSPFEDLLVWDTLLSFAAYNQYDASFINTWTRRQQDTYLALQQFEDARALQARTNYVEYIPR